MRILDTLIAPHVDALPAAGTVGRILESSNVLYFDTGSQWVSLMPETRKGFDVDMSGISGSYVNGDQMGSVITVSNFALGTGKSATITAAVMGDQADAFGAFDVHFYVSAAPTVATDSAAATVADADVLLYRGMIPFSGFDDFGGARVARALVGLPLQITTVTNANLYVQFVARSTIGTISSNTNRLHLEVVQHG